jgi:hypothetical protein
VKDAIVGPKNETTYAVELMYEKYDALAIISPICPLEDDYLVSAYRSTYSFANAEVNVKIVDWNTHSPPNTARKGPAMIAFVGRS